MAENNNFIICKTYPAIDFIRDDIENRILSPLSCQREIGNEWILEFDLPMVEKKDITVSLDGTNTITVEAKLREIYYDTSKKQQYEFHYFKKSITLPIKIDVKKIRARFSNGILTIRIPKLLQRKKIPVQ